MATKQKVPGMRGWIDLGSDVNWADYHGKWGKKSRDGYWYIVDFDNMIDSCGEREAQEAGYVYSAEVKRVKVDEVPHSSIVAALDSCGYRLTKEKTLYLGQGVELTKPDEIETTMVEALLGYGACEQLDRYTSKTHPARLRAQARRSAETYMK